MRSISDLEISTTDSILSVFSLNIFFTAFTLSGLVIAPAYGLFEKQRNAQMARDFCANRGAKPQAYFVYGKVEQRRVAQKDPAVGRFVVFQTSPSTGRKKAILHGCKCGRFPTNC